MLDLYEWKKRNVELSLLRSTLSHMGVAEIKEEIKNMEAPQLDELAALILQIRRSKDPERQDQVSALIDGDDWIPWKKEA